MIDKKQYLIRTLSRTRRKDYENYVINRVWNKLDDLNIKPVTQQYIKRNDNEYALLDLYFPQVNINVECNETYHKAKQQEEKDKSRTIDILRVLSAIEIEPQQKVVTINEDSTIEEINNQVDTIVKEIRSQYIKNGCPAWTEEDPVAVALSKGEISEYSDVSEPPIPDGGAIPIPEMRTTHSANKATLKTGRSIISC